MELKSCYEHLEPLLSDGSGGAIIREIQHLVAGMVTEYEQEVRRVVVRHCGRPNLDIPEQQLWFLLEHGFKVTNIAAALPEQYREE